MTIGGRCDAYGSVAAIGLYTIVTFIALVVGRQDGKCDYVLF